MDDLFDNAGRKIRQYAIGIFVVEVVLSVIGGIGLWFSMGEDMFLLGLLLGALVAGLGSLMAYITALFLVAYGDLVQKTEDNQQVNKEILEYLKENRTAAVSVQNASVESNTKKNTAAVKPSNPQSWVCTHCNTENSNNYSMCKHCGQYRTKATSIDYTAYGVGAARPAAPVAPAPPSTWFCRHCGTENNSNYSMCKKCGQYRS
jgi:hypothetical protein